MDGLLVFGVPITDKGAQFESQSFEELSKYKKGFHRLKTASYYSLTNGLIERAHRILKTALIAKHGNWLKTLPIVLISMHCQSNSTRISSFTLVTEKASHSPRDLFTRPSTNQKSTNQSIRNVTD